MKTLRTHLIFTEKGITSVRRHRPALARGEYAVVVELRVPDSVFRVDAPTITVTLPERPPARADVSVLGGVDEAPLDVVLP